MARRRKPAPLSALAQGPQDHAVQYVALGFHEGRLYFAFRTGPIHFASDRVLMHILSSGDMGGTWIREKTIRLGKDVREPFFLSLDGKLRFYYAELGSDATKFEPKHSWEIERRPDGAWSAPRVWGKPGEIIWEMKVRQGRAWATSYHGNHYGSGPSRLNVEFRSSTDGDSWRSEVSPLYVGGVSEVGFEFDRRGDLWAVTRNEDGDRSGFGSHLVRAPAEDPWAWEVPTTCDPERYDSPRMFRHGEDLYLIARRDVGGPFWKKKRGKWRLLWSYWRRPKRTALYRIDRTRNKVVWLQDLPGVGDTSFPAILRTGPHTYLIANYTSPLRYPGRSWMWGQVSPQGTQVYTATLTFIPR